MTGGVDGRMHRRPAASKAPPIAARGAAGAALPDLRRRPARDDQDSFARRGEAESRERAVALGVAYAMVAPLIRDAADIAVAAPDVKRLL